MTSGANDNLLIGDPEQLRQALSGLSPAEVLALVVRQALRTLPAASLWLDQDEEEALPMVLPTIRPLAAAHAMALELAAHEAARAGDGEHATPATLMMATADAGLLATDVEAAVKHATAAISRATSVVANRRTQAAFVHARNACAAAVRAAYAASAGADVDAGYRALAQMMQLFDGWAPVSADVQALNGADAPRHQRALWLLGQPLWLSRAPGWASEGWKAMREILDARKGEHWPVWTRWYDALLDPGVLAQAPSPRLARLRLQAPEAFWRQGPAVLNPAIGAVLADEEERELAKAKEAWEREERKDR